MNRRGKPHGEPDVWYRQRVISGESQSTFSDNYDKAFGKKDFISKKISNTEQHDTPDTSTDKPDEGIKERG